VFDLKVICPLDFLKPLWPLLKEALFYIELPPCNSDNTGIFHPVQDSSSHFQPFFEFFQE